MTLCHIVTGATVVLLVLLLLTHMNCPRPRRARWEEPYMRDHWPARCRRVAPTAVYEEEAPEEEEGEPEPEEP